MSNAMLPGLLPPLEPWEYIRLRRQAAGQTIAQAARPHWHRPEHRADVEATTARIEQPGYLLRADHLVELIPRSFEFDTAVYRQLRDEPPERHPTVCRGCGCTPWQACHVGDGKECTIGDDSTCSACEARAHHRQRRAA